MTTLMQIEDARCDARCYNAKEESCHCICGGRNHGKGIANARENTEEYRAELDDHGIHWRLGIKFFPKSEQLTIF